MYANKNKKSSLGSVKDAISIDIVIKEANDVLKDYNYTYSAERIINKELEEYIIKSVKNYPINKRVMLVFHILEDREQLEATVLKDAIHKHFKLKAIESNLFLRQQLIQWSINMFIGVLFLILCLILVEILDRFSYIHILKVVKESLYIIGWVALWEPLTFILFGWQNIKKDMLYHKKLSTISINVVM